MANTFFISDTHFGHKNIITFKRGDNTPLRDFASVEAMDEHMVENWNSVVKPKDTIYHLGDVVINRKALPILERLNGRKVLIKGNHDIFKLRDYSSYFEDIRAYKVMTKEGIICSHIPIHHDSLSRWKINLHGHLHSNVVTRDELMPPLGNNGWIEYMRVPDERYMCVSVEHINYTPLSYDEVLKRINALSSSWQDGRF